MSHDSNVTSNRFDFVKSPLAIAVSMAFVPHALGDVGSNDSFGGDQSGLPDLRHIDLAKDGTGATTTNTTYVARNSNISQLDIFDNTEVVASWNTFNISSGKELQIVNNNDFVLVNQVYGGASTIAGEISTSSGGTLVIVNTAGVSISDGAVIDAANLMISTSAMSNSTWAEGQTLVSSGLNVDSGVHTPFGITFDAFADDGAAGAADVTVSQNLTITGDLVIRADDDVVINDGSSTGNVQATNIYISTDRGTVTANNRSTLNGTSSLTIDTAPGSTGGAIDVRVGATELQGIDAGSAAVTLTAGGAITQDINSKTKGGTIVIKSDNMVGSSGSPIRVDGATLSVYGITHASQTGTNIATDNDIYIRATDSALQLGVLNSDAGNVYISGDQNVSDGDSDATTLDVVGSSLIVSTTGDVSQLGTAVSSLQTIGSGSVTVVNKEDTANGDVSQTGAINLVAGSSTAASEAVSITASTADRNITIDGAFDSAKSSGFSDLTIVTANTGGVISKGGSVKVKDLTIVADEADVINSANQIAATGTIVIRGAQASTAINLGTGTGALDLRAGELAAFADGATEMIIGASDTSGSNATTGALTVSGENVTVQNPLDIYAGATTLTNSITVGNSSSFTGTFTGSVTSGNDSTADIVASTIIVDTTGNFGASAADSIDVSATGTVSVSAGDASTDAADTIVMTSQRDLVLGALTTRGSAINSGDTVSLTSTGDVTDGNAGTANITAGAVTIDVTADEGVGTSSDYIEVVGPGATTLNFKVGGSDSTNGARFAGLHVETDEALTLQNDVYSTAGVTLRSAGAFLQNSKNINDNASTAISLLGTAFTLSGSELITTGGTVNLTDTSGAFAIANTAALTDYIAAAVSALTLTSTGGNVELGSTGALNASTITESGLTVTSSGNILVSNAVTGAAGITLQANSGTGKIYGTAGVTTTGELVLDAGQIDSDGSAGGAFVVSSGTLKVDTGLAANNEAQSITSAGAIDLRELTTAGSGAVSITSTNSGTGDHITIGAAIDSDATGTLTIDANDNLILGSNELNHAGAVVLKAQGAGANASNNQEKGKIYGTGGAVSAGELTLKAGQIDSDGSAGGAFVVSSSTLKVDTGLAANNEAQSITSAGAIDLRELTTAGSGAVSITSTNSGTGDHITIGAAIDSDATGTLTIDANDNLILGSNELNHAGAVVLKAQGAGANASNNQEKGKIYGTGGAVSAGELTLKAGQIDSDGSAGGAFVVSSSTLKVDTGLAANNEAQSITSVGAIDLRELTTAGSGAVSITSTNSGTGDHITIGAAIDSDATGTLTIDANDNLILGSNELNHAGAVVLKAQGAGANASNNQEKGKIYGTGGAVSAGELTLKAGQIDSDGSAGGAFVVSSSTLKVDTGLAANNEAQSITSAGAIDLRELTTAGSGAVSITSTNSGTGDHITIGAAIDSDATGTLTIDANDNLILGSNELNHAGAVVLKAQGAGANASNNQEKGKIYGTGGAVSAGELTLKAGQIDSDGSAGGAFVVSSSTLKVDTGLAANNEAQSITSAGAIDLRELTTAGSGAVSITSTNSGTGDHITIGAAIDSDATGTLTIDANDNLILGSNELNHAGAVVLKAQGAGANASNNQEKGKIYGTGGAVSAGELTLKAGQIDSDGSAGGAFVVSSSTLKVDTGLAANNEAQSITSAGAIDLRELTTAGSGAVSITSTNSGTGDHITIGAAIDSDATGTLTIDANDNLILGSNELNHAGAVVLKAQGAGANASNNQEKGKIYGTGGAVSAGELTLKAGQIDSDGSAGGAFVVSSSTLKVDTGLAANNEAQSITSVGAIDLRELTTAGSGAVSITSTNSGTGDHITIGAAIDSDATGTLTIDANDNLILGSNELNHAGAVVLKAQGAGANASNNQEKGKIYGTGGAVSAGELTLKAGQIDSDGSAGGAFVVSSSTLKVDTGLAANNEAQSITSAGAIDLRELTTAGSGAVSITSTNSGTGDHITIGAAIDSDATGTLTIDANDNLILGSNELNHAGAVVLKAQGAGANASNNQEKGKIYGTGGAVSAGELTLKAGQIDSDGSAGGAFVVSSSTLKVDTGLAANNEAQSITSAGAIDLRELTTAGSGAVSITSTNSGTGDHITIGAAIDSDATGTLTIDANDNLILGSNELNHAGAVVLKAQGAGANASNNQEKGKIYGTGGAVSAGELTLKAGQIDSDGSAGGAFVVSSSTLKVDTGLAANNEAQSITSAGAIDLRELTTAGSGAVSITVTDSTASTDDITIGAAITSSAGTGLLTLTADDDIDVDNALTHAGAITLVANGGGTKAGNLYGDSQVTTGSSSLLTLNAADVAGASNGSGSLSIDSGTLTIDAGAATNQTVSITSDAALDLRGLTTAGTGAVSITVTDSTASTDHITIGAAVTGSASTGLLTLTADDNIAVSNNLTHAGAVTLTANGDDSTYAGKVYGSGVVTTGSSAALTINADSIDDDADATDTGALGVVSGSLIIDGDAGTANAKISSTSSITTGSVDVENSGGDLELTATGSTSDITVGAAMKATNVTLTAGRNVSIGADVFAGAAAASAAGNAITIVANGGGSGVGSVTQSTNLSNGLSADDISITARTIGTSGGGQSIDIDLFDDNAAQIAITLGQVTSATYVGLDENDSNVVLEYLATDTKANDKTLDTVSISFTKDVSQTKASVDETAFIGDGAGVNSVTLTAGNFSSADLAKLTLSALNTRIGDLESNLGQGWSESVNVANVVAYIINGSDGVVGLDSKFNATDTTTTLSLTEFKAGQDAAGSALTIGSDLYNANTLLNALATYSDSNDGDYLDAAEVTLRDALLLGGTDTTVANLDAVFAGTVASGLTGITSSGLANLDGGIAVDSDKFTVDGGGTGNTAVAGTSTLTGNVSVAGTLGVTGAVTANAGITVDTLTIDASSITSTGAIILDATTDITLDADGADIFLKDDGTLFATLTNNSTDLTVAVVGGDISFSDENLVTTGNITGATLFASTKVDAAALEIGNVAGTGEFVVDANGALTMTGANVGVTVVDGSAATTARITSAGLADLTSLEVGNAVAGGGNLGEFTVAANGNLTNSGTTSLTGALTNSATTSFTGNTSITDADFTITDSNGGTAAEVLVKVDADTTSTTANKGAITLGGDTLTADSDGAISLTGSAITATADTSTITLNAATDLGVDAGGDITLDAGSGDLKFADDGTLAATFSNDGTDLSIVAVGGDIRTTGNVDAATLEVGDASGTGEFVVNANGALTMTGANVGITVNNGSADTARVTAAGLADLTTLEVGDATGGTGELTVAANGNLTNSGTTSLTGALTNTATTSLTGDTSITDADFTITDSNGGTAAEVLVKVDADTTSTTANKGAITLGGDTLTADSDGAISLTGSAITATADTSTITLNAATDLGVDAGGDITLDAGSGDLKFADDGTLAATFSNDGTDLSIVAVGGDIRTTGNVDAATLEVGDASGTGEFVVNANGALTMTGANVGITVNNGSADTARVTAAGLADLTTLEVGDATGGTGELTVAANGNLTNSGTTSLTGALTNTATTSLTGDTSITDADFTITDSNGGTAAEVLVKVDADTTSTTANKGAITLGGDTLTADSDGAISLTGSAITATADTSTITLNAATDLGVDAGGDITLDAGSGDLKFADDGTLAATFSNDGTDLSIVAVGGDIRTTGNVDAATLEVGDASGTGEFVVNANGALTMTGANVGITVNNGSADTARVTAAGLADVTTLEVGDATGGTGELTVAANGNLTNSGTTSLTGDTSITDADFTITDSNGAGTSDDEVLLSVEMGAGTTANRGAITLGGETLTADSDGAISLTGSAITATADTSTITLNAATDLGVDAGGDITLDAGSGDLKFADDGTLVATFSNDGTDLSIVAVGGDIRTTGNVDAATLEVGDASGTGEFVVNANGALTMTGANVGITVNNGSADTARVTAAGLADLTTLEVGDATGGTGELTVAANGNLTNSGTTSLTGDTSITDADFTITDSNGGTAAEVLVKVDADTTSTTANKGAITLGGDTLTADSDGAISLTGSAITATADTSTIMLNAATDLGVDAGGDITLDAGSGDLKFADDGTLAATFSNDGTDLSIVAVGGDIRTTGNVDAATLEVGDASGTGEFVVNANGALTMTGANVGITVNNGSADTARVTAAGLADLTTLEVGDATGGTGELTVAANGNLTNSGTTSLTGALTNTATTSLTGDTSITDADFTITDSNGGTAAEVLVKVDADTTSTTANKGAITLGGDTLTADSDGAISLTGSAITATADTSTITLNAATDLGVDAGGDITLDAGSGDLKFADDGTLAATFSNDGTDLSIVAVGGDIRTTGNVDAATLEVGDASGTGEFVVNANGALTMTGANVGITVNNGSADTARVTAAGLADVTTLEVGDATGGAGELTVAANGNLTNSGTTSLTGALTNTATTALTGNTTITDANFTITDSNSADDGRDDEVLLSVTLDTSDTVDSGAIVLGGATLTTDSSGELSMTARSATLTADSGVTLAANTAINGTLDVRQLSSLDGGIAVDTDKFTVAGDGTGNMVVAGTSTLTGNTSVGGTLGVAGATTLADTLAVTGNTTVGGTLGVTGASTVAGITASGLANLDGGIAVDSDKFTVAGDGTGNTVVAGTSTLTGNTTVGGTLGVTGASTLTGNTSVAGTLGVAGASTLTGDTTVGGTLGVTGASTLTGNTSVGGTLGVAGATTLADTLAVTGNTTVGGTLGVTGASTVAGITASGLANLDGGIAVDSDKFTVAGDGTGNTVVAGTSTLTGNTTVGGTLGVTGASTLTGNTSVAGTLGVAGASTLTGDTTVGGTLGVTGASTLTGNTSVGGTLGVAGATTLADTLAVTGNTTVGGTLGVTGASTVAGITASGLANLDGGIAVDSDKFTVAGDGTGNTVVAGTSTLTGNTTVGGTLGVTGASTLTGNTSVAGTLGVAGASTLTGDTTVGGTLGVTGASTLTGNTSVGGTLGVAGATTLADTLAVTGNTTVGGTLGVTGASTVAGITASGLANLDGGIAVDSDKFTVAGDGTGNTVVAGTSTLTGNTTVGGTLGVTGASTLTGNTSVAGTLGVAGASTLTGDTTVGGTLGVTGASTLTGNTSVGGTLGVTGATTLADALTVTGNASVGGTLGVTGASTLAGDTTVGGTLGVAGAAALADTLSVTGNTTLTTATAASLTATTADIDGGTVDGVTISTGKIGSVVTLVDANDTSRTLATLITTQTDNVAQTAVNVADIAAVTDIANRADTKADAIAEFRDSTGAAADAADGSDIVASATVLRAIDATAAKANSETLGAMEEEIDTLNADNAGGNSFLTFFRNLFGTTTAAGGGG